MLTGYLNASVERYARYYEQVHGDSVDTRALIPESFGLSSKIYREFHLWSRSADRTNLRPVPVGLNERRHQGTGMTCLDEAPADVLRTVQPTRRTHPSG